MPRISSNSFDDDDDLPPPARKSSKVSVIISEGAAALFTVNSRKSQELVDPSWSWPRQVVGGIIYHNAFDLFVFIIIFLNFMVVILDTNARAAGESQDSDKVEMYRTSQLGFLLFYTVETVMRFFVMGKHYFHDRWCIMDLSLIACDGFVFLFNEFVNMPSPAAFRLIKILRFARLLRAVRTMAAFRELYILMHGFIGAMKAILWCTILLAFILLIFGVIGVEFLNDLNSEADYGTCTRCEHAFESVQASFLTFATAILAGDNWGGYFVPLMELYPSTGFIFFGATISINLGLLNLILTVIVDKAADARQADKRYLLQEREAECAEAKKELLKLCANLDTDRSGNLTQVELLAGFDEDEEFQNVMKLMDIQREDLNMMFSILDEDTSGDIAYEEFVEQLHRMKSQDSQMVLVFIRSYVKDIKTHVLGSLKSLDGLSDAMTEQKLVTGQIMERLKLLELNDPQTLSGRALSRPVPPAAMNGSRVPDGNGEAPINVIDCLRPPLKVTPKVASSAPFSLVTEELALLKNHINVEMLGTISTMDGILDRLLDDMAATGQFYKQATLMPHSEPQANAEVKVAKVGPAKMLKIAKAAIAAANGIAGASQQNRAVEVTNKGDSEYSFGSMRQMLETGSPSNRQVVAANARDPRLEVVAVSAGG